MKIIGMGCTHHKQKLNPLVACKTVNGLLRVTIEQVNVFKGSSKLSSMDPYLHMKMSNQQFRGYIHKKAGRSDLFNDCYKPQGRSICVQLWNKHIINDKIIGMGTIDIDPILSFKENAMIGKQSIFKSKQKLQREIQKGQMKEKQNNINNNSIVNQLQQLRRSKCKMKVFLNNGVNQVGYLNATFQFIQQPVTVVAFKFLYASLRRTSSIFTTMHCSIQVIAGEQILRTHKQKDKDTKNPPTWQQQTLIFNIPKSLKQCIIIVLDDQNQVGRLKLLLDPIKYQKGQHFFTQQLEHNQTMVGVIKFSAMVGLQTVISQKKSPKLQQLKTVLTVEQMPQNQVQTQMKRQLPSQKSTKMQQSRTFQYTQQNQQQNPKILKVQQSNVVIKKSQNPEQ